jgi:ADP-dependent NAD(P)H-hydrate dehydratase
MNQPIEELPCPPLPTLGMRDAASHKGDFGHALLIGGSRGMSGAIALSAMAAMRTGAGLVTVAVPNCCVHTVASYSPCYMLVPLADDDQGKVSLSALDQLDEWFSKATCIAIGPGLGTSPALQVLCRKLLRKVICPLIMDADALNNLAETGGFNSKSKGPLVITPHPGEWSRLNGGPANDRGLQRKRAIEMASKDWLTIILKGHETLVTDGCTAYVNTTGTPAMAIGGSGDVLTGIVCGLICQGLAPRDAAHLAVFVHGRAGQLAQQQLGSHVILPTDLIENIGRAFRELQNS